MKLREGDQQLPVPNDSPDIQSLVIADIEARRQVGIERYGTALQAHNGRDALRDLYEELIDGAMYTRQVMVERDALIKFLQERRADSLRALLNCHPDNRADYYRWTGHAELSRQLLERLGAEVPS